MHHKNPLFLPSLIFFCSVFCTPIHANQQVVQEVLDGTTIPKYIEPLPTFHHNRVDGRRPLRVTAKEFQQKILPDSFYSALPCSVRYKSITTGKTVAVINPREGTYVWGYEVYDGQKTFGPSLPGPTIIAQQGFETTVKYVNKLIPFVDKKGHCLLGPLLQKFLTFDQSFCWANPLNASPSIPGIDEPTGLPLGNPAFFSGPQPMTVHIHGAEVPSYSDGGQIRGLLLTKPS